MNAFSINRNGCCSPIVVTPITVLLPFPSMKNVFYLFAIGFMLQTQHAFAQTANQLCQQAYSQTISTCANGLANLPPSARPGAQEGCVDQAKAAKAACLVGGNNCLSNCDAQNASDVATCNSNYNASLGACGTDPICQAIAAQALANCINTATVSLNACVAACPAIQ